jgi:hypothetical protein
MAVPTHLVDTPPPIGTDHASPDGALVFGAPHMAPYAYALFSNRLLLWGIAFELVFTAAVIYTPPLQHIFGTAALSASQLAIIAPFPVIVWGVDELARWVRRHRARRCLDPQWASSPCLCGLGRDGVGVSATRGPQRLQSASMPLARGTRLRVADGASTPRTRDNGHRFHDYRNCHGLAAFPWPKPTRLSNLR